MQEDTEAQASITALETGEMSPRARTTWIVILVAIALLIAVFVFPLVPSLLTSSDAPRNEAESALHTVRDRLQVYSLQHNNSVEGFDLSVGGKDMDAAELGGQYYDATDYSLVLLPPGKAIVTAAASSKGGPKVVMTVSDVGKGIATIVIQ